MSAATGNYVSVHNFARLDDDDQPALLKVLDALVTKTKLRALTAGAS